MLAETKVLPIPGSLVDIQGRDSDTPNYLRCAGAHLHASVAAGAHHQEPAAALRHNLRHDALGAKLPRGR